VKRAAAMDSRSARLPPLVGVVLAGGISRRYGSEKALLRWKGRTFLDIAAARLRKVCREIVLSVDRPGRFRSCSRVHEIPDLEPGGGAAMGILSVLRALGGRGVLVTPVDMPLLPESTLRRLLAERGGCTAVVLKVKGRWQPLVGVYEPEAAPVIERCLGEKERKIVAILRKMKTKVVRPGEKERRLLVNINTPADIGLLEAQETR
jgi:molybdopterin-guanine dinucleotide biosynthesis protein A